MIRIAGRKDSPGRPFLYETTREFLVAFGLRDLADLPQVDGELIVPEIRAAAEAAARRRGDSSAEGWRADTAGDGRRARRRARDGGRRGGRRRRRPAREAAATEPPPPASGAQTQRAADEIPAGRHVCHRSASARSWLRRA